MKKIVFIFLIFSNCKTIKNEYVFIEKNKYINQDQKEKLIHSLEFFDLYLLKTYPEYKDENKRIIQFLNDYNSEDSSISLYKSFKVFEPYIKELDEVGFFDIILTNNSYDYVINDDYVNQWMDSIGNLNLIENKIIVDDSVIGYQREDTLNINNKNYEENQIQSRYIGNNNRFMLGLREGTNKESLERKLIDYSINPMMQNTLIALESKIIEDKLSNPIIKTIVFYNTVLMIYDFDEHKMSDF